MKDIWTLRDFGLARYYFLLITFIAGASALIGIALFGAAPLEVIGITAGGAIAALLAFAIVEAAGQMILGWCARISANRVILGHMVHLVRQNLPLAEGLAEAARSESGLARRYLERIAPSLKAGFSLAESIDSGWPGCPRIVIGLIESGERTGQLGAAVEYARQMVTQRGHGWGGTGRGVMPYAGAVTLMIVTTTLGLMVAIVPKFKLIFEEFQSNLPASTTALIVVSEWLVNGSPPGWVLLFIPMIGVACGVYVYTRPRRGLNRGMLGHMVDVIRWYTPGLRRLEWSRGIAAGLRVMGMALHSGLDLPAAARLASELDVNLHVRRRLARFAELTQTAMDPRRAAAQAGLGEVAGLALVSGLRGGDIDTAVRYAADYYDALISRWWLMFSSMVWPAVMLGLGVVVAFIARAMFEPLVILIDATARAMP